LEDMEWDVVSTIISVLVGVVVGWLLENLVRSRRQPTNLQLKRERQKNSIKTPL